MTKNIQLSRLGQGMPIVLIHGWGVNAGIWQPLAEQLANNFEVITIDLPGFGLNVDCVPRDYSLENIADLIASAVTREIGKPALYLGWSLGGLVATQIALSAPEKVLGLINVASSPCFVQKDEWPGIRPEILNNFYKLLSVDTRKTIDNFLKIQAMGSPQLRTDIKTVRDLVMKHDMPSVDTLSASLKLLENVDLRGALEDLNLPALSLYGRLDTLVPKGAIAEISKISPNTHTHTFEHSSHAPFISELSQFAVVVEQWVTGQISKA